ncbi:MAG TPA: 50S ribosomal protein L25 [Polyangiaceae bacterium]|nr:50S ribosomal protein L25 [Polyangiaceae bacterium]
METVKIEASRRQAQGKGVARRLRAAGQIPAVAYGKGQPAEAVSIAPKDVKRVLAAEHGRNSVIELSVDGKDTLTVLLTEYQYHPVSRDLLHADFYRISLDEPVEVDVPLELKGKAAGVVLGGVLRQVFRRLPVRCLPKDIPTKITHDVTALEIDGTVATSDLQLPPGVEVRLPPAQTVAAVVTEKRRIDEEAEAAKEAEATAAAAAAAPAADAKAEGKDKSEGKD